MAEEEAQVDDGYQPGEKVDLKTLVEQDAEDESLRKYKESLLGNLGDTYAPADDDRRVVITEFRVIFEDRPDGDIVYELDDAASLAALKSNPFTLKQGCHYKIQVSFRVQHDLVAGLQYHNVVSRGPFKHSEKEMIGSFPPRQESHVVVFPRRGWEEAPSGMAARGKYKAVSSFVDDDKEKHLEFHYGFSISKEW